MCGIAGIVAPAARGHEASLARMLARLAHRGPDGEGTRAYADCLLGHRRLAIVDLESGAQPMATADGALAVTFNGEIYGYRDLRASIAAAHAFRTESDTEVLLALYERDGPDLVRSLPGMFAFALWDDRERRLVAARDRFGEKPFYWARGRGGELVFASEAKGVLASGLVDPALDLDAVREVLQRLYVPPDRTIWSNVHVLPPAHRLVFTPATGRVETERYWRPPPPCGPVAAEEAAGRVRTLLEQAVRRQLVADVPVGAFLSGGLDSTTIVSVASRLAPRITTVSFGFEGEASELPYAAAAARAYGTRHLEVPELSIDVAARLLELADVYDEPLGDSSNVPTYEIAREARRHLKVVLTGDGGDELLAGYDFWYQPLWGMERARSGSAAAERLWRLARNVTRTLGLRSLSRRAGVRARGVRLRRAHPDLRAAHAAQGVHVSDRDLVALGLPPAEGERRRPEGAPTGTVDDALRMDLQDYMPGDILVKVDRASMAHGLELRAPFLDVDLASYLVSLPSALKIGPHGGKRVLRDAFERDWPPEVRRRGKQGFGAPVGAWLRRPDVRALKARFLESPSSPLFDLLSHPGSRAFVARDDQTTWTLLVLAIWLDRHPPSRVTEGGTGA